MDSEPGRAAARERDAQSAVDTFADREARNPFFRYLMHLGLPLTLSLLLHVAAIVFLAVKTFDIVAGTTIEVGEYEATLTESLRDQMDRAFSWSAADPLEMTPEPQAEESFESLTALNVPEFDVRELDSAGEGVGAGDGGAGLGIGDGALALLGTGAGAGAAGTGGLGSGMGGSGIGQAGIWDLTIRANKIAYVVDFSGSIIVAVDDLKRELKRSIGRLQPSQSFNVIIFYSTGGGPSERVQTESFKPRLEAATREARLEFFEWIDRRAPRGATEPLDAMKRALALRPEAIFFFSDGYFEDRIVAEINRANNAARAAIYCLVFDELLLQDTSDLPRETEGSRRLRRIAEANGGKVKIVTGKDLAR